jgi:hypothetical protein
MAGWKLFEEHTALGRYDDMKQIVCTIDGLTFVIKNLDKILRLMTRIPIECY